MVEWPCWRGVNRDGKSPDRGLLKRWPPGGPKLLWKSDVLGRGFSSVTTARNAIYITGDEGARLYLYAFDMDGNLKWKVDAGTAWTRSHPGSRASVTIDEDRLYLLSGVGELTCFDAATGVLKWRRMAEEFGGWPGNWGYAESVLIHKDLVVFKPGGNKCIVALNKLTGEPVWSSSGFSAGPEYSSCIAVTWGGQEMIITGTRAGIVCVEANTGRLLWSNDFAANNTANCPTPAYSDGYVFWANGYGTGGICLKLVRGLRGVEAKVAWTTRDMNSHHGGYVVNDGYIYGNNGGGWACLHLGTGRSMWKARAVGKGSLCYADQMLYLFSERGGRAALATCSPAGLEIRGEVQVEGDGPSWAHPVVVGGRLYLRYDKNLYCFDVRGRTTRTYFRRRSAAALPAPSPDSAVAEEPGRQLR